MPAPTIRTETSGWFRSEANSGRIRVPGKVKLYHDFRLRSAAAELTVAAPGHRGAEARLSSANKGCGHQPDDDFVGEGPNGERFQFPIGIEREIEHRCGTARDGTTTAFEGGDIEDANRPGLQIDADRNGLR